MTVMTSLPGVKPVLVLQTDAKANQSIPNALGVFRDARSLLKLASVFDGSASGSTWSPALSTYDVVVSCRTAEGLSPETLGELRAGLPSGTVVRVVTDAQNGPHWLSYVEETVALGGLLLPDDYLNGANEGKNWLSFFNGLVELAAKVPNYGVHDTEKAVLTGPPSSQTTTSASSPASVRARNNYRSQRMNLAEVCAAQSQLQAEAQQKYLEELKRVRLGQASAAQEKTEAKSGCSLDDGKVKKACANCSCGRGELEAQHGVEKAQELIRTGQVESKCGNCFLGDDYRCEGCPFRGTPAFQKGEIPGDTKVTLLNVPDA